MPMSMEFLFHSEFKYFLHLILSRFDFLYENYLNFLNWIFKIIQWIWERFNLKEAKTYYIHFSRSSSENVQIC